MMLTEILTVASPMLVAITTLAGILWRREVQRGDRLEEEVEALEASNRRLVAAIAVGATTEEMREELADYLRGGQQSQQLPGSRRGRR